MAKEYRIDDLIGSKELYHHGIKGQKWGVRRFQKKDGSLTPAGKERYDDDGPKKKQPKIPKTKSMYRINLEDKYQKQGMTKEQAEQAAAKRIRGEQFAIGAAAVTVAACVAYNKHKKYSTDKIISKNTELHRIMGLAEHEQVRIGERQYVSYKKLDNMKYRGFMGEQQLSKAKNINNQLKGRLKGEQKVYDFTIKSKQDLKVASEKRAKDTLSQLFKNDSNFRDSYVKSLDDFQERFLRGKEFPATHRQTVDAIRKGKPVNEKKAYDLFNFLLINNSDNAKNAQNAFYDSLKKQGMNAIIDTNDKKHSFTKAIAPIITFDGSYDYVKREMNEKEIYKDLTKSLLVTIPQHLSKTGASLVAAYGGTKIVSDSKKANAAIRNYKQEHPNTTKTDKEILDMLMKDED